MPVPVFVIPAGVAIGWITTSICGLLVTKMGNGI